MNSKKALERLLKYANINEAELITKYGLMVFEKEVVKVRRLKKHKKIVGEIYHITLNENSKDYTGGVAIHATLNTTPGAYDFIKLAFLEEETYYTKACLDAYDAQF